MPDRYLSLIEDQLPSVKRMLELGNKRSDQGPYKPWFEALGIEHVSVDWNGLDGALAFDLRAPLPPMEPFDMVTNFGTSEHVSDQDPVWRNMLSSVRVGGWLVCATPLPGDWPRHGEWYPCERFYVELAKLNGLELELLEVRGEKPKRLVCARLKRVADKAPLISVGWIERNMVR